jgi:predicted amidohydrolase
MRITSIQLKIKDRSKEEAVEYVMGKLDDAPDSDLLMLPEVWPTGYFSFDHYEKDSEEIDGPLVERICDFAVKKNVHIMAGSFVERDGDNLYNTSLFINPSGEVVARYRKIHLFGYQSDERRLLTAGNEVVVFDTPWGKAGICVCYDLRFPEFFRKMVDEGAKFFLVASAWPHIRLEAWKLFNLARAHENLAYLFSCNCSGVSNGMQFAGHSMFVDPKGIAIASAGDDEAYVSADVDMGYVEEVRKDFSALNDRVFK